MRGGAVERGQGLVREFELDDKKTIVWCFSMWLFGGFDDLGVLKDLGVLTIWVKIEVLRKFKFAGVFIQVAIHDLGVSFSEILGAHQMSSRARRY
jgi:hypothetical protein